MRAVFKVIRRIWFQILPFLKYLGFAAIAFALLLLIPALEVWLKATFPWLGRLIDALPNSQLVGQIEGVSIIIALVVFLNESRKRSHHEARQVVDTTEGPKSYTRIQALEALARDSQSLRDLSARGADLNHIQLSAADLRGADLQAANLMGAQLWEANLEGAALEKANLCQAKLTGAVLRDARLTEACLEEAKLLDANLQGAILTHANLQGADLRWADLREANLSHADLLQNDPNFGTRMTSTSAPK